MTTLTVCVSFCVPALFQHCVSASVFAFVLQQFAFVLQHLCSHWCCSICVRIGVASSVFALVLQRLCFSFCVPVSVLHKQPIAINDNLDHLRHLCCSHISNTTLINNFFFISLASAFSFVLSSRKCTSASTYDGSLVTYAMNSMSIETSCSSHRYPPWVTAINCLTQLFAC
jgi:hypothetical protein